MAEIAGARVQVFLPITRDGDREAAESFVAHVRGQYGGETHSSFDPPAYHGFWTEGKGSEIFHDEIVLLQIDFAAARLDDGTFRADLNTLRRAAFDAYAAANASQEEIWLTVQTTHILLGDTTQ